MDYEGIPQNKAEAGRIQDSGLEGPRLFKLGDSV